MVREAMTLGDHWQKPLYELLPDRFPQGRLTEIETALWGRFYSDRKMRRRR